MFNLRKGTIQTFDSISKQKQKRGKNTFHAVHKIEKYRLDIIINLKKNEKRKQDVKYISSKQTKTLYWTVEPGQNRLVEPEWKGLKEP